MNSNGQDITDFLIQIGQGIFLLYGIIAIFVAVNLIEGSIEQKKKSNIRRKINIQILKLLSKHIEKNPDQRFGQILRNTGVVVDIGIRDSSQKEWETPDYYWMRGVHEESSLTLIRMNGSIHGTFEETKIIDRADKK